MLPPNRHIALATTLLAAACQGPLVSGEASSEAGEGTGVGGEGASTGDGNAGARATSSTATGSTTGASSTGDATGGDDAGGSGASSTSSRGGANAGGSQSNGGQAGETGSSAGGASSVGGGTSGGAGAPPSGGCDTCEPTVLQEGAEGIIHYGKCAAMRDGVVYQSVLDLSVGALTPDVVVRAVTLETGAATPLSASDEAVNVLSSDVPVLGVDDAFAYWFSRTRGDGDAMRLRRRALSGAGEVQNLVAVDTALGERGGNPRAMAVASGFVYWSSGTEGVFRCPTSEQCVEPERVIAGSEDVLAPLPDVLGLDLDGDTLYWADTTTGQVRRRTAGGTDALLDTASEPLIQICDVSFESGALYWILCLGTYEVRRVDPSGPSSQTLATTTDTLDEAAAGDLLVDGDDVYFISSDFLYRVPKDGSASAQRLAVIHRSGEPRVHTVVGADADDVLLVDDAGGILSVPR